MLGGSFKRNFEAQNIRNSSHNIGLAEYFFLPSGIISGKSYACKTINKLGTNKHSTGQAHNTFPTCFPIIPTLHSSLPNSQPLRKK